MIKKVEGIIVSTVDYKESSKILNIFTKEDGMIGVMARGCKNPKSRIASGSKVISYGEFHLNYRGNSMPTLLEVDIANPFQNIYKDIVKLNYSLFLLELTSQVYRHENDNKIYELLLNALKKINEGYDALIIVNIIELKMLDYLGIKPEIGCCVVCGNKHDIVTISGYRGGYLCKRCYSGDFVFHLKTLKLIKMFYAIDIQLVSKIEISEPIKKELGMFIDEYYERYAGLYLKSKDFVKKFVEMI